MHALYRDGWSKRRIATDLRISRNTLDRYLRNQPKESRPESNRRSKLSLCLEWLKQQDLTGKENYGTLQQRLKAEYKIHVSQRTITRALHQLEQGRAQEPETTSCTNDNTAWRIGPYEFSAKGELNLFGHRIEMTAAQAQLLLLLVKHPNQLVGVEEIAEHLWPGKKLSTHWRRNVSLSIHRLRQVFALGPLSGGIIRCVHKKGYVLTIQARKCATPTIQKQNLRQPSGIPMMDNPFYFEVHDFWSTRDPYQLPKQEGLLQRSVSYDPLFMQGYLELCYIQILQCFWGMRASQDVLPYLRQLLDTVEQFTWQPPGWLAIKAEVQSLLLWQPLTTQRLYGTWLAETLPRGMPLFAWTRHLIFTGKADTALSLIKVDLNNELRQGWLVVAMAHLATGNFLGAEAAIQVQLSLDSTLIGTRLLLALLLAHRGQSAQATRLVLETGILDRPFQGVQALAAYSLAKGPRQQRAHQLLNEAMARINQSRSQEGALAYWGLAALALERTTEAIQLLKLSIQKRCYSAPVLFSTALLKPYRYTSASRLFAEKMRAEFPLPD